MFLLTVKKKFIKELTEIGVVLTGLVAFVFHLFIPEKLYFLWFPAIPIFFYLFGLFYIYMFAFGYRLGLDKLASVYLLCKMMKFILSMLVLLFYGFFVRHEVDSLHYIYRLLLCVSGIRDPFLPSFGSETKIKKTI